MATWIFFIVFFTAAALVPVVWWIVDIVRGQPQWVRLPGMLGLLWAVVLLSILFINIARDWGGCPADPKSSSDDVTCYAGGQQKPVSTPMWTVICRQPHNGSGPLTGACPSKAYSPVYPFCEPVLQSKVKQPWATWSDLSFVAAGLWLLWLFRFFGTPNWFIGSPDDNPMSSAGWLPATYAAVVIFMGPPSMWYHASMKAWGDYFDVLSVLTWMVFNAGYVMFAFFSAKQWIGRGATRTIGVMVFFVTGWIVSAALVAITSNHTALYFLWGGMWGLFELVYLFTFGCARKLTAPDYSRNGWWFLGNGILLGLTLGVVWLHWNDSAVGAVCAQRTDFPGHALFHIMASVATVTTYFSFASERKRSG